MTTFDRVMTLYWCLLPLQLAFTWLDVSRQRAPYGTWHRAVAARRQLLLAPGSLTAYTVGFAAVLALAVSLPRLDGAGRLLGLVCSAALLGSAWLDARRLLDAWHDSGHGGWWRRLRRRLRLRSLRRPHRADAAHPWPRPVLVP